MAQQEDQEIYDVYLSIFSKARSGVQMTSDDFKGEGNMPYTGRALAAATLGAIYGKDPDRLLLPRSELHEKVDDYMK